VWEPPPGSSDCEPLCWPFRLPAARFASSLTRGLRGALSATLGTLEQADGALRFLVTVQSPHGCGYYSSDALEYSEAHEDRAAAAAARAPFAPRPVRALVALPELTRALQPARNGRASFLLAASATPRAERGGGEAVLQVQSYEEEREWRGADPAGALSREATYSIAITAPDIRNVLAPPSVLPSDTILDVNTAPGAAGERGYALPSLALLKAALAVLKSGHVTDFVDLDFSPLSLTLSNHTEYNKGGWDGSRQHGSACNRVDSLGFFVTATVGVEMGVTPVALERSGMWERAEGMKPPAS
jgi:hypothetical protein